jgi:streptogramin lyase
VSVAVGRKGWVALAAIGALAIVAGAAGAYDAISSGDRGAPAVVRLISDDAGATVNSPTSDPLGQVQTGDPAVQFPAALADLPFSPTHLAIDQTTGDIWFMEFTYAERNTLYRYSERTDKLESFPVPASKGSELYSAIAVDSRGHVISAEGFVVLDFDPATETYKEYPLPQESPYENQLIGDRQFIADMALSDGGLAYVSQLDVAAITEIDLESGSIKELPLPKDFGQADDITVVGETLWVANVSDIDGGPPAQMGSLDLASGQFTLVQGKTTAIDAGAGQVYAVTWHPGSTVATVAGPGLAPVIDAADDEAAFASSLSGTMGHVVVDRKSGRVWATAEHASAVVRVEPSTKSVRSYLLPSYEAMVFAHCPEGFGAPCPASTVVNTRVRGLSVSPSGDLWFSDGTRNRTGVIRAGE